MKLARRFLRRRRDDERGATLILTAICMVALLGTSAMAVDLGFTVYGSRQAQAMADTAALDIVQHISTADSQLTYADVQSYISGLLAGVKTDNGSNAGLTATPGWYSGGTFTAQTPTSSCANTVFSTSPPPCNAVRVSATQVVPQIFWGGFNTLVAHGGGGSAGGSGGGDCTAANACTTTAWTPESGFSIGSYLLSINTQQSAVLNVLLSKLGTSAGVTILGYQGLANTYVSVNQLIAASGGLLTTSNVMTTSLTGAQWLGIWQTAVANQVGSSTDASAALNGLSFSGSTSAELCQMVSISGSTCANGALKTSALSASLDALQMLTTEAELANGGSALNVGTALNIPGVSAATLNLTLIQPPQLSNPYPGPVGSYISSSQCPAPSGQTSTCATTAQLTSDIKLTVGVGQVLDIPLSAAQGTATLSQVNCVNNVLSSVKINVGSNALTTTGQGSGSNGLTLAGANIGSLQIAAIGAVHPVGGTYTVVPPNAASEASGSPTPNPQSFGATTPVFTYSGLTLGALDPISILLKSTLPPVLGPVLQSLGVTVGGAQVADLTARCDVVSIVG